MFATVIILSHLLQFFPFVLCILAEQFSVTDTSSIYLSIGFHSPSGIRRPVSHLDVGIRLPLQLLFVLVTLHILRCLLIFVLDLKSLQSSHRTRSPFFSFSLFSCCVFLSSSFSAYILPFPIAHILLLRAILATDFLPPQYGHIPFGAPMQNFWWLVNDVLSFRVVLHHLHSVSCCLFALWIFSWFFRPVIDFNILPHSGH